MLVVSRHERDADDRISFHNLTSLCCRLTVMALKRVTQSTIGNRTNPLN
jgi:hypothetical protein